MIKNLFLFLALSLINISCERNFETLRIISSSPGNHSTGITSEFYAEVEFNNDVNRMDVEDNFRISGKSDITGAFNWMSGRRFRFIPLNPVNQTGRYVMELPRTVRDTDGNVMESDFISDFYIGTDFTVPLVTGSIPPFTSGAAASIPVNQNITFDFSKSMNRESVEAAFRISPDVPGYFTWSESIPGVMYTRLTYYLLSDMTYGRLYTVTVSGSGKDIGGNSLGSDYTVNFITGNDFTPPLVSGIYDAAVIPGYWVQGILNGNVARDAVIAVDFSEAMDRASVESAFSITPSVQGSCEWISDMKMIFTPSGFLNPETNYQVYVSTSARDINGLRLGSVHAVEIRTGAPDSLYVKCGNISGSSDNVTYNLLSAGIPSPSSWPLIISMGTASNQTYCIMIQFVSVLSPYTPVVMNKYSVMNNTIIETYKSEPGSSVNNASITDISWPDTSTVVFTINSMTNKLLGHTPALYRLKLAGGINGIKDINSNYTAPDIVIDFREAL